MDESAPADWAVLRSADKRKGAILSVDGVYRYALTRRWGPGPEPSSYDCHLVWCLLNPSTADHEEDDPTIRRIVGFSKWWGADACTVVNLFALRATDPLELHKHPDPIGPRNDEVLAHIGRASLRVICAWGAFPGVDARASRVEFLLRDAGASLLSLGLTKAGFPKHPLYLPSSTGLQDYVGVGA